MIRLYLIAQLSKNIQIINHNEIHYLLLPAASSYIHVYIMGEQFRGLGF